MLLLPLVISPAAMAQVHALVATALLSQLEAVATAVWSCWGLTHAGVWCVTSWCCGGRAAMGSGTASSSRAGGFYMHLLCTRGSARCWL